MMSNTHRSSWLTTQLFLVFFVLVLLLASCSTISAANSRAGESPAVTVADQDMHPRILKVWFEPPDPEWTSSGYHTTLYVEYDPATKPTHLKIRIHWRNANGKGVHTPRLHKLRDPSHGTAWYKLTFRLSGEYTITAVLSNPVGATEITLETLQLGTKKK